MSLEALNLEKIAAPVSEQDPAGQWLKQGSPADKAEYEIIVDSFKQIITNDRALLSAYDEDENKERRPQALKATSLRCAREIRKAGIQALQTKTKDIEIATYLLLALCRTDGFPGLKAGVQILRLVIANFWDHLHPKDEGRGNQVVDLAKPRNALSGHESLFAKQLDKIPLFPDDSSKEDVAFFQGLSGAETQQQSNFVQHLQELNSDSAAQLILVLQECQEELRLLNEELNLRHKSAFESSWSPFTAGESRSALGQLREFEKLLVKTRPELAQESATDFSVESERPDSERSAFETPNSPASGGKTLRTRNDAFRILAEVAEFFSVNEPQSLIPILLNRAIELGKMKPDEYLKSIVQDEASLAQVFRLYGVKPKDS